MPQNWKTYKLEDAIDSLIDYRGKTPKKTDSGIPLVTAKIVKRGTIQEPKEFIANEDYEKWMVRGFPEVGDVVLTTEAPLGEVAIIKDSNIALAQRIITLRGKKGILDSKYLKYFLQSSIGQNRLIARESGTTVTGIKQSELRKVLIDCPVYYEQKAIANILSAIDAKIENNLTINKILEDMAMALYKEWFVDFGPFQDGKFVESELGMIPEGWEVKTVGEIGLNYKKTVKPSEIVDDVKYLGLEHFTKSSLSINEFGNGSEVSSNKFEFQEGDILFGKLRPYFKKVGIAPYDGICSTDVLVIRPIKFFYYGLLIGLLIQDAFIDYCTLSSTGTRMPRTNWTSISEYKICLPTKKNVIQEFNGALFGSSRKILQNIKQNQTLIQLRDTLLSKLISGEVRLNEFDLEEVLEGEI